jgi:hypothetical protein
MPWAVEAVVMTALSFHRHINIPSFFSKVLLNDPLFFFSQSFGSLLRRNVPVAKYPLSFRCTKK